MVRWDSPLFTVPSSAPEEAEESLPLDDIWKAVTEGNVKPPNAGTVPVILHIIVDRTTDNWIIT